MKATQLLRKQHEKVTGGLKDVVDGTAGPDVLEEIADDLAAHMAIEQQLFYPAVYDVDRKLVEESYEEHAVAELELKRLLEAKVKPDGYKVKANVLLELLQHHIEEEQNELFPAVEKAMSAQDLESLGLRMEKVFAETQKSGYASAVPEGFARTSSDDAKQSVFGNRAQAR